MVSAQPTCRCGKFELPHPGEEVTERTGHHYTRHYEWDCWSQPLVSEYTYVTRVWWAQQGFNGPTTKGARHGDGTE